MHLKLAQRHSRSKKLLDGLYSVPDPFKDYESQERFYHHDLAALTAGELCRERDRVRWRLTMEDSPDEWLLDRLDQVTARLEEIGGSRDQP